MGKAYYSLTTRDESLLEIYIMERINNMKEYIHSMNLTDEEKEAAAYPGVTYMRQRKCWRAQVKIRKKIVYIGRYDDPISAKKAVIEYNSTQPQKAEKPLVSSYTTILNPPPVGASGHRGVRRGHECSSWCATIGFRGKNIHLGSFPTIEEAVKARQKAEAQLHYPFLKSFEEAYPRYTNP